MKYQVYKKNLNALFCLLILFIESYCLYKIIKISAIIKNYKIILLMIYTLN